MNKPSQTLSALVNLGDRVLLSAICWACCGSLALGFYYENFKLALGCVTVLFLIAALGYVATKGTTACRYIITFVLVSLVALQIHLAQGQIEYHFGVFVALAFLLVYLDWKVILFGAVLFAVHHVAFDRLQAAGFAIYCTTKPDFFKILLHASYVVLQSVVEVVLAIFINRAARTGEELVRLVEAVNRDDGLSLNVEHIPTTTSGARKLKQTLQRMEAAVSMVRDHSHGIEDISTEIVHGNDDLNQRTEQTASILEDTNNSTSILTETVKMLAENAEQANVLSAKASDVAVRGGEVMRSVVDTMQSINQSSKKISDIISVIDGIAFQTNILALNAAVEAARAGEQGRGFAVVAGEVRSLASRSAQAAKEIKGLINDSVMRVEQGSALVDEAGSTMGEIVVAIGHVTNFMEEISAASNEQRTGVTQMEQTVRALDRATQQNAGLVVAMAGATTSLKAQAQDLVEAVQIFLVEESMAPA